MFILDLLVAVAFGLAIVWIVSLAFNTRGPWNSLLWFFMVVALFAWAGGVWLVPFGPSWGGIGWFPILFMGIIAVLLLTAASPRTSRKSMPVKQSSKMDGEIRVSIDALFWVLIVFLLVFGTSHYVWYPRV
jgi:multisubunit Na+/H+ antiporter MnhB subunit